MAKAVRKKKLSLRDWFATARDILCFKPLQAFEKINTRPRQFLPYAFILVFVQFVFSIVLVFTWQGVLNAFVDILTWLFFVFITLLLGQWLFKGKGTFLGLLSCSAHLTLVWLYTLPLLPFLYLIKIVPSFSLGFLIVAGLVGLVISFYIIGLSISIVRICHALKTSQSVIVWLLTLVVIVVLTFTFTALFNQPLTSVGSAIANPSFAFL